MTRTRKLTSNSFDDLVLEPEPCVGLRPAVESVPPDVRDSCQGAVSLLAGADDCRLVVMHVEHHERTHQNQFQQLDRRLPVQLQPTQSHTVFKERSRGTN